MNMKNTIITILVLAFFALSCKKTLDLKDPNSAEKPNIDAVRAGLVNVALGQIARVNALVAEQTFIASSAQDIASANIDGENAVSTTDIKYAYDNTYRFLQLAALDVYQKEKGTVQSLEASFLFWYGANFLYQQFDSPTRYEQIGLVGKEKIDYDYLVEGINAYIAKDLAVEIGDDKNLPIKLAKDKYKRLSYMLLAKLALDAEKYEDAGLALLEVDKNVEGQASDFSDKDNYTYVYAGTSFNNNAWIQLFETSLPEPADYISKFSKALFVNNLELFFGMPFALVQDPVTGENVKKLGFFMAQKTLEVIGAIELHFIQAEVLARTGASADKIKASLLKALQANAFRIENKINVDLAHLNDADLLNEVKRLKYKVFFGHYALLVDLRRWQKESDIIFNYQSYKTDTDGNIVLDDTGSPIVETKEFKHTDRKGNALKFPKKYQYIVG
jgi:hypothetical protein